MADTKKTRQAKRTRHQKSPSADARIKYKQMTLEILFTDGRMETVTFYTLENFMNFMNQTVRTNYTDSIRIELF
ncbi:MAG: hypothetical protein JXB29_09380 [Sedimentisphaerales bacterium]|nr:hypothetical protein [Sedimentisphaerales bacterium]